METAEIKRHDFGDDPIPCFTPGGQVVEFVRRSDCNFGRYMLILMSMEIEFPLEFIVEGTAVSLQAKRRESLAQWKERIVEASREVLPEGHFASENPMAVTLYYFPSVEMQGDIDNIVKPILDALSQHIYMDDQQVQRVLVQKFEPGNVFGFTLPTAVLGNALSGPKPAVYIRLSDDPFEGLV